MRLRSISQVLVAAGMTLGLLGCATSSYKETKAAATSAVTVANDLFSSAKIESRPMISENSSFWVDKEAVLIKDDNLPDVFGETIQISLDSKTSLRDTVSFLARTTGMRFSFASDVQKDIDKMLQSRFKQTSSLRNFLDQLVALPIPAMSWQFKDGQIEFFRTTTRVFAINIPKTDNDFSVDISSKNQSGSGGGSSSSSGHSVRLNSKLNFWDSVGAEITPMLTPGLGTLVVSKSTGNVTVTDTPQALASINTYVNNLNEIALRRVFLDVQILTVQDTSDDSYGVDWSALYNVLQSKYKVEISSPNLPLSVTSNAGSISTVLKPGSGSLATSNALVAALSEQGKTTKVGMYPQWTMSGVPTHSAVNKTKSYVQNTTVTPATVVGAAPAVSMTTAVSTTGVSLHCLPRVFSRNTIQLEESIEISTLDKMTTFGPPNSQLQLPEESRMAFLPITTLKSGETLLLAGMAELDATITQMGMGSSQNELVVGSTGSRSGKLKRNTVIVLITPHLY